MQGQRRRRRNSVRGRTGVGVFTLDPFGLPGAVPARTALLATNGLRGSFSTEEGLIEDEGWLGAGVAGALAREYAAHQRQFLESLARLLESALPDHVEVERRGGLLAREKPVAEVRLDLGDDRYLLASAGRGPLKAGARW